MTIRQFSVGLLGILLLIVLAYYGKPIKAQTPVQDIPPYGIGQLPNQQVFVYKQVYQGCELFIVAGKLDGYAYGRSVAIATGHGCK